MNATGLLTVAEAAEYLCVGGEQVRRYIARGLLPAAKLANAWVVRAIDAQAFAQAGPPSVGRPLTSATAWSDIVSGGVDLDDPHRYENRGTLRRFWGTAGMVADLLERDDLVVSGMHAAASYGALLDPLNNEVCAYVRSGSPAEAFVYERFALNTLGEVSVRFVDETDWQQLFSAAQPSRSTAGMIAPRPAVALDLVVSKHPRERQVAREIGSAAL